MPQMTMYVASTWSLHWLSGAAVGVGVVREWNIPSTTFFDVTSHNGFL
jgi:hypothetical protein